MNLYLFLITTITAFLSVSGTTQEHLLKMGQNSDCIKKVIDNFIKKQTCQYLKESQKSILAIKMTNCLNTQMGKENIAECEDMKKCKIQGDDWYVFMIKRNTFTSFLTHIDNLCHFYWDLLHHQRTESLVDGLKQSAFLAEDILRKNYKQTQEILSTQGQIQAFMQKSLAANQKLSSSLIESEEKLQNMTQVIQKFLNKLNENILSQYSYLVKAIETINQGLDGINTFNSFMISEISSMSGMLYFLVKILAIAFLTSFSFLRKNRLNNFIILLINIILQLSLPGWILAIIGIKNIRIIFFIGHFLTLMKSFMSRKNQIQEFKSGIDGKLSTRRIKRIFKEIIEQAKIPIPQKAD